jgi:hypothetical protein
MRFPVIRRTLALLALLAASATASAADLRALLGAAKTHAVEIAFASAAPAAKLDWTDGLKVTFPSGTKSDVRLLGPLAAPAPDGSTIYVMQVELPDVVAAIVAQRRDFSTAPPPAEPTDFLAAVRLTATGEVVARKIGRLDPTSVAIEVKQFVLVDEYDVPQTWPGVNVTYWGYYGTTDWFGAVRWDSVYDFELMTHNSRMPLGIVKARATGDNVEEHVLPTRTSPEIVSIEGGVTEQVVQYPCPAPCMFDGKSLLAAWGVTAQTVATN